MQISQTTFEHYSTEWRKDACVEFHNIFCLNKFNVTN